MEPPGQWLVYDEVFSWAQVVALSSGEGSWPRASPHGSDNFAVERLTVVCWRMSLSTSLPS